MKGDGDGQNADVLIFFDISFGGLRWMMGAVLSPLDDDE
jgi:hypothetical protein